jgi:[CysO sulfur-carrier protein]-S-L-cysteine hydrolase
MLHVAAEAYHQMVAHCLDGFPEEACGLLGGTPDPADATVCYPARNDAASARVYTVNPLDLLRADRAAEDRGLQIVGVFHSHTHTDASPSPTDVAQAPDPDWHYVIVSLQHAEPVVRSFRIAGGVVGEEPVRVAGR